ncbi:amidase [Diaporthe helianthi]|uniref:Amidase n=1 Tax=Diaporthe helianthi TaxID=158607 RepID=A0A2P5HNM8_DIAHE|nr:amidase [Diaporthe helianthi]
MLLPHDLHYLTASEVLKLLENDTITVETYAQSLLNHIKDRDDIVKAWAYLGKTTTTEFTVTMHNSGPDTTNPHDPGRTPGGSSCGSAAAVADFQVPISLGAQTGGSIIRPASFTGTFAMKPTHNSISTEGQKEFSPTFDTFGFFARSLEDLQLLAGVFALQDDKSPKDIPLQNASVALINSPFWPRAGPGTVAAMSKAATILKNSGVKVDVGRFSKGP